MANGEYKNIMIMKNGKFIGFGLWVIGMLLVSVPTLAQQQQWQSTSAMQGTGSAYAPQVTAVGATSVGDMATTTGSAKAPGGPRRVGEDYSDDWGHNQHVGEGDTGSPVGDALIPLLVMSLAFGGYIALRRKRTAV